MALDTYSGLKASLASWIERSADTTYTGTADDFIDLSEAKFTRMLAKMGHRKLEETSTLTTDSNGEVALPADFVMEKSLIWDGAADAPLEFVSWSQLQFLNPYNESGVPCRYSIQNSTVKVGPIAAGDILLTYYETLPALSDANTTNWLLTLAPDAYLFMGIAMGHAFNEDESRALAWEAKAAQILEEAGVIGQMAGLHNASMNLEMVIA
jgi:hypothetical protein